MTIVRGLSQYEKGEGVCRPLPKFSSRRRLGALPDQRPVDVDVVQHREAEVVRSGVLAFIEEDEDRPDVQVAEWYLRAAKLRKGSRSGVPAEPGPASTT